MSADSGKAIGIGTALQVLMVVVGHLAPGLQAMGLFPVVGTLLGGVTGWLAAAHPASAGNRAMAGATAGAVAGVLGSLVSTALGDVPVANALIAGCATLVSGAIGGALHKPAVRAAA